MPLEPPSTYPCDPGSGRIPVHRSYDLVVIGGGINGAGVARDAALRGLSTLLLEKGDFASGTTSWSTRLIHGGLRYLETFELALVRESLREREILLRTAPHLVRPLQLTLPIYRQGQRPAWQIRAGMTLYDLLSFDKSLPNHRMLSAAAFRHLFPHVDAVDLLGAAQYYDGQVVYAERLCLETVLSAQQAGATVLNYAQVTQIEAGPNGIHTLAGEDRITGVPFRLTGLENAIVVNTTGPWLDQLLGSLRPGRKPLIGGTKGSHLLVERFPGSPSGALYVEAKSDGRPLFVVPWGWDNSLLLIGTTDIPYNGDLDAVKATPEEIDYLLQEVNRLFPQAHLPPHLSPMPGCARSPTVKVLNPARLPAATSSRITALKGSPT
ncbi:MAG: glycerol-3-phosphate dehydrogenase/oxidase [Thermostichus sp. DRC_bins_24]